MTKRKLRLTELMRRIIARQQKWCCALCLNLLDASFDIDHIVALMNNGEDSLDNLQALCANCHRKKTVFYDLSIRNGTIDTIKELLAKSIDLDKHFNQFKYKTQNKKD
jgi:5-methylcytosine-specific restriction endonuclease McrA